MSGNHNWDRMPIYHFAYNTSCEKRSKGGDSRSNIIVMEESYEEALSKAEKHIKCRSTYAGRLFEYDLVLDWIENPAKLSL